MLFRLEYSALNQPDICSGDYNNASLSMTNLLSSTLTYSAPNFGRFAIINERWSASTAL
tara:strand:- start:15 stop:191 length:177 start_codon:yes stop_codon:yes gene_type:complete